MSHQPVEYAHRIDSVAGESEPNTLLGLTDFRSLRITAMRLIISRGGASSV